MRKYSIPPMYVSGFESILTLDDFSVSEFSHAISNITPGERIDKIIGKVKGHLPEVEESVIFSMISALISIVDIFEDAKGDIDKFTTDFADSYLLSNKESKEIDAVLLKNNLSILLANFHSITITSKAQIIITENNNNFKRSKVISDIRLLFDSNLEEKVKNAVVVHNLKIEYSKNENLKTFFVSLDANDLRDIKNAVDRAIEKDRIIRSSNSEFTFIDTH